MPGLHGPVLAAVALGEGPDEVLLQADAIASSLGSPLFVVHVVPEPAYTRPLFPHLASQQRETARQPLEKMAADLIGTRVQRLVSPDRHVLIVSGSPHSGVLAQAEAVGAGLIVMGPGSASDHVTRHADVPVLIARPSQSGSVLGATDFSDDSLPAIHAAADEAARRRRPLRVIHCLGLTETIALAAPYYGALPPIPTEVRAEIRQDALTRLQEATKRFGATGEAMVADDGPVPAITAAARSEPTELVVVGKRGRTKLPRLLLGSVAERIVREAPCSVLVVQLSRQDASDSAGSRSH